MSSADDTTLVSLRFHSSLYPLEAVRRAAERFVAFGPAVEPSGVDVLVSFAVVPPHLRARLPDEFRNHALFEAIVAARC